MTVDLRHADSLDVLPTLAAGSVSAIVCDPPYAYGFMGRAWDSALPELDIWAECLRVLRPGGHLLAFGGTRTSHRLAVAIEDAGFEIRDTITWLYGSGFPKSLDVGKAIDKAAGVERAVVGAGRWAGRESSADLGVMNDDAWQGGAQRTETAPATAAARQWQGWGTALKPASEPIIVARKPLVGTVAATVLEHGTGALNIDATRVGMSDADREIVDKRSGGEDQKRNGIWQDGAGGRPPGERFNSAPAGRWPANVVLTHAPDCADVCTPGGEISLRVYADAAGELAPDASLAHLLDRQRALLARLRACSTSGTTLWPGASEFYRSEDTRSSGARDGDALLRAVRRALGRTELPGSPGCCPTCHGSDGVRVREVLEAARGGLPSLLDALERTTRQAVEPARTPTSQALARPSSSDAPGPSVQPSCTHPSSTCAGCPPLAASPVPSPHTSGTARAGLHLAEPVGSTAGSSTGALSGSAGTADHSGCTYATVRLLTLLAFDLASRFVAPDPGVSVAVRAFSLPSCPVAELDTQSGTLTSGTRRPTVQANRDSYSGNMPATRDYFREADSGGASRFFPTFRYQAKAPTSERPKIDGQGWPTVKPLALMRWLVRLVTPPGGTVLDPFAGTGTTLQAAELEGFDSLGVERDPHAYALACQRLGIEAVA